MKQHKIQEMLILVCHADLVYSLEMRFLCYVCFRVCDFITSKIISMCVFWVALQCKSFKINKSAVVLRKIKRSNSQLREA